MKSFIYAIHDKVANESAQLFEAKNDAVAIRKFQYALLRADHTSKNDFALLRFGTIDHELNVLKADTMPTTVEVTLNHVDLLKEDI